MPDNLSSSHLLAAATPATRTLAVAELELAEAARQASDFARGMVPNGHMAQLEPGTLVQDALRLVDHAQQVLAAAIRHEQAHGSEDAIVARFLGVARPDLALDPMTATGTEPEMRSDAIAERLLELDAWVCRHTEPEEPIASTHPVTEATVRHLTSPL